jgi:hypothetical protein
LLSFLLACLLSLFLSFSFFFSFRSLLAFVIRSLLEYAYPTCHFFRFPTTRTNPISVHGLWGWKLHRLEEALLVHFAIAHAAMRQRYQGNFVLQIADLFCCIMILLKVVFIIYFFLSFVLFYFYYLFLLFLL